MEQIKQIKTYNRIGAGLTLRTFRGRFAKPMEGHVATALHSFVRQSLLQKTERTDIFSSAKHQRWIALVTRLFESALQIEKHTAVRNIVGNLFWKRFRTDSFSKTFFDTYVTYISSFLVWIVYFKNTTFFLTKISLNFLDFNKKNTCQCVSWRESVSWERKQMSE